jgi:hypothetical protein
MEDMHERCTASLAPFLFSVARRIGCCGRLRICTRLPGTASTDVLATQHTLAYPIDLVSRPGGKKSMISASIADYNTARPRTRTTTSRETRAGRFIISLSSHRT